MPVSSFVKLLSHPRLNLCNLASICFPICISVNILQNVYSSWTLIILFYEIIYTFSLPCLLSKQFLKFGMPMVYLSHFALCWSPFPSTSWNSPALWSTLELSTVFLWHSDMIHYIIMFTLQTLSPANYNSN